MDLITVKDSKIEVYKYENESFVKRLRNDFVSNNEHCLILDYETYLDLDYRSKLISSIKGEIKQVYSRYEVLGAFIKEQTPEIEGEVQVVDIQGDYCYSYLLDFQGDKYQLSKKKDYKKFFSIQKLYEKCFKQVIDSIVDLNSFINDLDSHHGLRAIVIHEGLKEYRQGKVEYNELFIAFDNPKWANVLLSDIELFKKEILELVEVESHLPIFFFGDLNGLFQEQLMVENPELIGGHYLIKKQNSFYGKLSHQISLEGFVYPNKILIPLYEKGEIYEYYSKDRKLNIFNNGSIVIQIDNVPFKIPLINEKGRIYPVTASIDGNQQLIIQVGQNKYIV